MVSIEGATKYKKRVAFNKPFGDIDIFMGLSTDYISTISPDTSHILWLDYDEPLSEEKIADVQMASSILKSGSLIIVTVDVDFDKAKEARDANPNDRKNVWYERFRRECGDKFDPNWQVTDFTPDSISSRSIKVLTDAISDGINMRDDIKFKQLFNFKYADGHEMITFGGMLCSKPERRLIKSVDWDQLPFIVKGDNNPPFQIDIPILTRKERLFIDSQMPCDENWLPDEFEITTEELDKYRQVYRYSPSYAELFL